MVKTAAISLRVEPELKAALEAAATADRRTLASFIEKLLAEWVEANAKPAGKRKG